MRKPDSVNGVQVAVVPPDDSAFTEWPLLWEHLTSVSYEDGSPRQTSTLMVFAESGLWKAWLHDRDLSRSAWGTGVVLDEALEELERGLRQGGLSWRADSGRSKGR